MKQTDKEKPLKLILDPCCGSRIFWFDKKHENTVYGDVREQSLCVNGRTINVSPDLLMDFTDIPFPDETFNLVVFDPPHLKSIGDTSVLRAKYGRLDSGWEERLKKGFDECYRVLSKNGTLIFKWSEYEIKAKEIYPMFPCTPLFGHKRGGQGLTHWYVFMKLPRGSCSEQS